MSARMGMGFGLVSREERREAELFFADLVGRTYRQRVPPAEAVDPGEG